ncbi:MAG TPA: ribonuclease E activity regulator RraA [Caulobacteraceae bacterium]|jgi:regulator of ribonuclease activity A
MTDATADLYDQHGEALQVLGLQMRSFGKRARFSGLIRTVRCYEDNSLARQVLETPGHGQVLVVDGGGSLRVALLGDQMAELAVASGWAGVVINGVVRDNAAVDTLDLGVKALGTNPRKGIKRGEGETDVIVTFGGVIFTPGHRLFSDEDGVVVMAAG